MLTSLAQAQLPSTGSADLSNTLPMRAPCDDPSTHVALKEALRLVCSRQPIDPEKISKTIVVGLLGGFVKHDDVHHPEVLFARYLRRHYGTAIRAEVFENRQWKKAVDYIVEQLRVDNNAPDRQQAKIVLYGHSWGAAQIVVVARELQRQAIPVALTIQIDSVKKLGQNDRTIPANVGEAVNFYQRRGLTPGESTIVAADSERTVILGNFPMVYSAHQINCDNYRWLSRWLNKPHHQIENDPEVWDRIAFLIDSVAHSAR